MKPSTEPVAGHTPGPLRRTFSRGDPVNVSLGFGMWVSGTVVRVNHKSIRVEVNRDIYRNGTRQERFPAETVYHAADSPFSPLRLAGEPFRAAIAKAPR